MSSLQKVLQSHISTQLAKVHAEFQQLLRVSPPSSFTFTHSFKTSSLTHFTQARAPRDTYNTSLLPIHPFLPLSKATNLRHQQPIWHPATRRRRSHQKYNLLQRESARRGRYERQQHQ